jgi:hypothetical protein
MNFVMTIKLDWFVVTIEYMNFVITIKLDWFVIRPDGLSNCQVISMTLM